MPRSVVGEVDAAAGAARGGVVLVECTQLSRGGEVRVECTQLSGFSWAWLLADLMTLRVMVPV